jgi:nucleoside-diphosphate-sugar epimerase
MKKLIKKNDYIIPLAALVGAPLCKKFKKDAVSTNLTSIKTLSKITTKKNKVIFLTTNSGYGIEKKGNFVFERAVSLAFCQLSSLPILGNLLYF